MPKTHNIGPLFIQFTNFPYKWDGKFLVKGWTQEIDEPYRTSTPFIVRLPKYKALVFGRWTGAKTEEEALNDALGRRDLTDEDFTEEAGWTPAPDSDRKTSGDDFHPRLDNVDGAIDVHDWQTYFNLAKESERG